MSLYLERDHDRIHNFESHITKLMSKLLQHSNKVTFFFFLQFGVVSQVINTHTQHHDT